MRSRRRSSVVQIPTASIQMDLHTLYMENINGAKKKGTYVFWMLCNVLYSILLDVLYSRLKLLWYFSGKLIEEPIFGRRLQKNSSIYGSCEGDGKLEVEPLINEYSRTPLFSRMFFPSRFIFKYSYKISKRQQNFFHEKRLKLIFPLY